MQSHKKGSATNTPSNKRPTQREDNTALQALQDLRNICWQDAIKYRFDPVLSRVHEKYLNLLNEIMQHAEIEYSFKDKESKV